LGHRPMVNGAVLDKIHTGGIIQNTAQIDRHSEVLDSLRVENRDLQERIAALEGPLGNSLYGPMIFERSN